MKLTNGQIGVMVYMKYYPTNVQFFGEDPLTYITDSDGRRGIGYGTADSTLYFKVEGKNVEVWTIQQDPDKATYQQGFDQSIVPISNLIDNYYIDNMHQRQVHNVVSMLEVY